MANTKVQAGGQVGGVFIDDVKVVDASGLYVAGTKVLGAAATVIPDYAISWTGNEPTAGSSATIVDGDIPTVLESGQAIADLTAKMNVILAMLRTHGLLATA